MSRYILKTLGCKANLYDSQVIEQQLQEKGWSPTASTTPSDEVTLCIVNSCTVTDEAEKQSRKMAKRLAKQHPHAKVVMTGCSAEVNPEELAAIPGIHFVVGNQNKDQLTNLVLSETSHILSDAPSQSSPEISLQPSKILGKVLNYKEIASRHPMDREWPALADSFVTPPTHLKGHSEKTRSFLKIQEGCNSFCTYCIIPYGRGPGRSIRPREVIQQVRELVDQGIREVVTTGTNIGDYGTDWNSEPVLGDLLEMILSETSLERLRVSSLDPVEVTPQILDLMKGNPRFCPHFHISLQSPHSRILRLMKRKYRFEEVQSCLEAIARIPAPVGGVFVGMDVITGFPGETDEEFEWTVKALEGLPWSRLHVFPYSERQGTPASRLPDSVAPSVRVARARRLNQLSLQRLTEHYQKVLNSCRENSSLIENVLLERESQEGWIAGYTPNYLRVMVPSKALLEPVGGKSHETRNKTISIQAMDLMIDSSGHDVAIVGKLPAQGST